MSSGKGWDLTSLHSCEGGSEWIRKNAGALLVLVVVRAEDLAFALDPMIAPKDARDMVDVALEGIVEQLVQKRLEGKPGGEGEAMKARYWTCGCGRKNVSRETGRPECSGCGKAAAFAIEPPRGQGGFDFGKEGNGNEDGNR